MQTITRLTESGTKHKRRSVHKCCVGVKIRIGLSSCALLPSCCAPLYPAHRLACGPRLACMLASGVSRSISGRLSSAAVMQRSLAGRGSCLGPLRLPVQRYSLRGESRLPGSSGFGSAPRRQAAGRPISRTALHCVASSAAAAAPWPQDGGSEGSQAGQRGMHCQARAGVPTCDRRPRRTAGAGAPT